MNYNYSMNFIEFSYKYDMDFIEQSSTVSNKDTRTMLILF